MTELELFLKEINKIENFYVMLADGKMYRLIDGKEMESREETTESKINMTKQYVISFFSKLGIDLEQYKINEFHFYIDKPIHNEVFCLSGYYDNCIEIKFDEDNNLISLEIISAP